MAVEVILIESKKKRGNSCPIPNCGKSSKICYNFSDLEINFLKKKI